MQIPVLLDRSQPTSLTGQLVEQLRNAIRQGRIASGTRLPSSRRLSEQLDIARNTVVRAYELLVMEGYVELAARVGDVRRPSSPRWADAATRGRGGAAGPWRAAHADARARRTGAELSAPEVAAISHSISVPSAPTPASFRSRLGAGCCRLASRIAAPSD